MGKPAAFAAKTLVSGIVKAQLRSAFECTKVKANKSDLLYWKEGNASNSSFFQRDKWNDCAAKHPFLRRFCPLETFVTLVLVEDTWGREICESRSFRWPPEKFALLRAPPGWTARYEHLANNAGNCQWLSGPPIRIAWSWEWRRRMTSSLPFLQLSCFYANIRGILCVSTFVYGQCQDQQHWCVQWVGQALAVQCKWCWAIPNRKWPAYQSKGRKYMPFTWRHTGRLVLALSFFILSWCFKILFLVLYHPYLSCLAFSCPLPILANPFLPSGSLTASLPLKNGGRRLPFLWCFGHFSGANS